MKLPTPAVLLVVCLFVPAAAEQQAPGRWEGVISDPRRPVVVHADFTTLEVSLSGGPPVTMTRRRIATDDGAVEFEIPIGQRTFRFAGTRAGNSIKGDLNTDSGQVPFWLERLPEPGPPADRGDAWRQDLDVVLTRFLRYDRAFSDVQRAAARERLEQLKTSASRRHDQEILVELSRIIALSGNAHTRLYFIRNRTEVRRIPIRVWWFRDELRVVRAAPAHRDLLGCRVTRIGESDTSEVFRRVRDIKAGNESWRRYMSVYFLTSPDILFGAGAIADPEHVAITMRCGGANRRVELAPVPLRRASAPVEAWWDLVPSYSQADGFATALTADRAPLYLRNAGQNYWFEYMPLQAVIYLQYNRSQESSSDPMSGFVARVTRAVDERPVKALIVDVRFNTGGDAGVGTPLAEKLAERLHGIPVFVLTGRATFSAGITHAAQWKQLAGATVIGERVGDSLDMWSEGGNLILPRSGLTVHYANGFHAYSQREYPPFQPYFADLNVASLEPDVLMEPGWDDYAAGRDPVLDIVAARIRRGAR